MTTLTPAQKKAVDSVAAVLRPAKRHSFLLAVAARLQLNAGRRGGGVTDALLSKVIDAALRELRVAG